MISECVLSIQGESHAPSVCPIPAIHNDVRQYRLLAQATVAKRIFSSWSAFVASR
jgi:hypothetical protein